MTDIRKLKDEQRREMLARRNKMSEEETAEKSRLIFSRFTACEEFKNADVIATYISFRKEPDTLCLAEYSLRLGKKVAVPVTDAEKGTMLFSYIESVSALREGAFGIPEPQRVIPCRTEEIDIAVIPGLVFDTRGGRIGFGKGFYDRFLEHARAVKAALCYDFQVTGRAAAERHDVPMDMIITERRCIYCGKE